MPSCPDNFTRYPGYPGVCLPPCDHGCPVGYDQVPLPNCPEGYHRDLNDADYCAPDQYEPGGDSSCMPGMVYSFERQACVADCPQGSYVDAIGLCKSYYETECPQGLRHDPETGRCVPPGDWPAGYEWVCLPQCPEGYVRDIAHPTRCLPPPSTCVEGYERTTGNRCEPVCAEGTRRDSYGYCVPSDCPEGQYPGLDGVCREAECPSGYEKYRGNCMPPCDEGYGRNEAGYCIPPDEGCPSGTQRFEGECIPDCPTGYDQDPRTGQCSPPSRGCAPGEELVRGTCVAPCDRSMVRNAEGRCVPTGCAKGEERVNGICLPRCEPPLVRDANNRCACAQGTELIGGRCLPRCREGMTRSPSGQCLCRPGTEFVGGRCEPECKRGLRRNANGECVPLSCPEGEENVRGRCLPACLYGQVRNAKGKCICPPGEVIGPSGYCQTEVTDCPEGYRRNESGQCVRKDKNKVKCPEGYSYSKRYKTCLPDKRKDEPVPDTRQDEPAPDTRVPDMKLPPLEGQNTKRPDKRPPEAGGGDCPKGYVRNKKGKCVKG